MITTLQQKLLACGIMPTPQRLAVFASVAGRKDHPSVDDVFNDLREKMPTLSKTTVYTTMQLLAEKHLIATVHVDEGELRFDGETAFHAHFRCRECGRVFDVMLDRPHRKPFAKLPEGFEPDDEELIYYGLCPKCKKKKGNRK